MFLHWNAWQKRNKLMNNTFLENVENQQGEISNKHKFGEDILRLL
jgi:hypothetical protein